MSGIVKKAAKSPNAFTIFELLYMIENIEARISKSEFQMALELRNFKSHLK